MQNLIAITRHAGLGAPGQVRGRQGDATRLAPVSARQRTSAHVEAAEPFWLLDPDLHCGHPCSWRAVAAPLDQLVHCFGVAFGDYLHAAVGKVARPAGDAERERPLCAATAVPNSLDSAPDPEVPADHLQKLAATYGGASWATTVNS